MMEAFFSCEQSKPRTPATPYRDTYYVICLETSKTRNASRSCIKHTARARVTQYCEVYRRMQSLCDC